ncbi:unnamed protein product [Psylliodes chrysocephalus]|uniref:Regulatory protein zeste n=1 Tax=Psylliodes chrysocephalus TaxID=3402493 RepID=A0A9P0DDJ1_9CUCU|nr:unnamed protein product [Psylliodes chrysocephala]
MAERVDKRKMSHCTEGQKRMLVSFLESDEELRKGKFTSQFTYKESQRRWETISQKLNSVPGAKKEWASWRRTWQDLKKNVKKNQHPSVSTAVEQVGDLVQRISPPMS